MKICRQYNKVLIILMILSITGCNDFLDEVQDNRTLIDSEAKVAQLVTSAYADAQYAEFALSMSDNADDKGPSASLDRMVNEKAYMWEDFTAETTRETTSHYWEASYEAIAAANHALEAIEELGGGSELDKYKGEALVARAYAHFMLVNFFSMRYDPATAGSELGIPYVTEPEKNAIVQYKRETIGETYRLIGKDLEEGLKLVSNDHKKPKFHFTKDASMAFATRFYLYKGEWQKVVDNANGVFRGADPATLIRDGVSPSFRSLTYDETSDLYSSSLERANLLVTWTSSLYGRNFWLLRYGLSNNKTFLFSEGNPFGRDWGYRVFGGTDFFLNIPKYQEYFRITNIAQQTGLPHASLIHFTTDEVLLNRAEAYAMLGDNASAIADLTAFLSQKTLGYDPGTDILTLELLADAFPDVAADEYTPFYDLTPEQAVLVKGIAEFRRREFYHEGLRWLDVKRFNIEIKHGIFGKEVPIKLLKDDIRRAVQIPEAATAYGIESNRR